MSEVAAVIVGFAIGCLIGLPALVAYRHDIASNFRRLLGGGSREQENQSQAVRAGAGHSKGPAGESEGLSPAIATFAIGAGAVTALYGAFIGGIVFFVSGVFLGLSVLVGLIAKAVKG